MPDTLDVYVAPLGDAASVYVQKLVYTLRQNGIKAETDHTGRGLRAQMKYADKLGCKYSLVLGEDEIASGKGVIKNMKDGTQTEVVLENLVNFFTEGK